MKLAISAVAVMVIMQGATLGVIAAKQLIARRAILALIFAVVLLGVFVIMTLAGMHG